jgi:methyl acetate hydrolase
VAIGAAVRAHHRLGMIRRVSRRTVLRTIGSAAVGASLVARRIGVASAGDGVGGFDRVDAVLRAATTNGDLPGIVALVATETGIVYDGRSGVRRLPAGAAMTSDTVFRVASMVKPITSVAALQLVEQGRLSLDAPVPDIDPALGSPQVLDGFDAAGAPRLRPAKRPISLRQLLTHTSGFVYRLWDAKAVKYQLALERLPAKVRENAPRTPLMFDPGERWQYGTSINWVGRLVEAVSGEPLDVYFRHHILDPLGMKDTAFVISEGQRAREASVHRREGDGSLNPQPVEQQRTPKSFSGGGGIYATAPDYLTFLRMLLHGGALGGVRILRADTVAQMGENQIGGIEAGILKTTAPALSRDIDFFPGISLKWGFGHMINMRAVRNGRRAGSLTWGGLFNTYYWIDPAKRLAAVFMTQVLPFGDERALAVYRAFEQAVYKSMAGD